MENETNKIKKASSRDTFIGCSAFIIILLLIILGVSKCGCSDSPPTKEEQSSEDSITIRTNAIVIGEEAVKNGLKSPTSAEFDNERVIYGDTIPGDTINLIGTVDADNAFGAKLRNNFYVKMVYDKDFRNMDNWNVVDYGIIPRE